MPIHVLSQAFNGGVLDPLLDSRSAVELYASGCRRLENFIPHVNGPIVKRPGTHYLGAAYSNSTKSRLEGFNFGASLAYVVEFAVGAIRIWRDGALLATATVTSPATNTYTEADLFKLQITRSNDVAWIVHPSYVPQRLVRYSNTDWRLEAVTWDWPPLLDENVTTTTLTASAITGSGVTLTASAATFNSSHVGSYWQIAHRRETAYTALEIPVYPAATANLSFFQLPIAGQQFAINGQYYTFRAAADTVNAYDVAIGTGGSALDDTKDNVIAAIEATTGSTAYGPGTARHPDVTAEDGGTYSASAPATGLLTSDGNVSVNVGTNLTVKIDFATFAHTYRFDSSPSAAYDVKIASTAEGNLRNLVAAINLTGLGDGTDYYGTGMVAHTTVTAALTSPNTITITARTAGTGGNAITLVVTYATDPTRIVASGATLSGGSATSTCRVKLSARRQGDAGNDITVESAAAGKITNTGAPSNNDTVVVGAKTYTYKTVLTPAANEVLINGGDGSLLNLSRAINLTGTPGTDYGAATTINATAFAEASVTSSAIAIVSKTVAASGATVVLTESATNTTVSGSGTLTAIVSSATLVGGVDYAGTSDTLRVQGSYDFTSYGVWQGTVFLERLGEDGTTWEVIRTWRGDKNRNIVDSGSESEEGQLRIRVEGAAGESSTSADVPRFVLEANDAKVYGFVKVTGYTSTTVVTVEVLDELWSTDATPLWTEGAFSAYRGYPTAVCFHEARLCFGGTSDRPGGIWCSVIDDFQNFRRTSLDDASFFKQLPTEDVIQWMTSGRGILFGTSSEEWLLTESEVDSTLTPLNGSFRHQSSNGSINLQALKIQDAIVHLSRNARKVRRMAYDDGIRSYGSGLLTARATHLTRPGVQQMAVQQLQDNILWMVTSNSASTGKLISLTYEADQNVIAFAEHNTSGTFESVAVINGSDCDEVWFEVLRSGVRYIERFHPGTQTLDRTSPNELCYCDCATVTDAGTTAGVPFTIGVTYEIITVGTTDFTLIGATANTVGLTFVATGVGTGTGTARNYVTTLTGLSRFNGLSVDRVGDGVNLGAATVSGGAVAISPAHRHLIVGLNYSSVVQPMKPVIDLRDGTSRSRYWTVSEVVMNVHESRGGGARGDADHTTFTASYPSSVTGTSTYTGDLRVGVEASKRESMDATVIHSVPLPFTLTNMTTLCDIGF